MINALNHRGPDDRGVLEERNAILGMTRLAIIDTGSSGHQPMLSPDGQIAIVYNGELYNFREERLLLEKSGHSFRSTSDTEVVLRMYEHYGDDFLLRMRGMFALAIHDKRSGPDASVCFSHEIIWGSSLWFMLRFRDASSLLPRSKHCSPAD